MPPGGDKIPKVPDVLSLAQLRELAAAADMQDPDTAAAVAMAESGGRQRFKGPTGKLGLWGIHPLTCPKEWANADMLLMAGFNAQAAASMSSNGTNWSGWESFTSGRYKQYLPGGK